MKNFLNSFLTEGDYADKLPLFRFSTGTFSMSKKKTYKQKRLASQPAGAKFSRLTRPFVGVQTMYVDLNVSAQIKENSP